MLDVSSMTVEKCMDWVAEHVLGWRPPGFAYQTDAEHSLVMREWSRPVDGGVQMHEYGKHPCGTPTIDSAARLMRELCPGVMWQIGTTPDGRLSAHAYERYEGAILRLLHDQDHDQDEECELRWRLLVACLMAQKKEKA